jgi:hypothetical protein
MGHGHVAGRARGEAIIMIMIIILIPPGKNGKCEDSARPFGRGGREGGVPAPCHEVSLRRKGQQKPAAWACGRGGTRGCAPSIQEIQKFEFFGPGGVFFEEAAGEAEGAERGAVHLCGAAAKESRVRRGESACG